jgi:hypothetical protein
MLCYRQMQTTKEIYNLSGRFYIISSPKKITRFPPPKFGTEIINSDISAQEYWETVRRQVWSTLSSQIRATFAWPTPGEILKNGKEAFKCLKLDSMLDQNVSLDNPDKVNHEVAFDNFCLLVFKVSEVIRFEYGVFPPKRVVSILLKKIFFFLYKKKFRC